MKFKKFTLDESMFDDAFETTASGKIATEGDFDDYIDDDFSDPDTQPSFIPDGPAPGEATGLSDTIINLINDEWEAIQGYNNFSDMLKSVAQQTDNSSLEAMLPVIADIVNEENKHVGQLQELLKLLSPNATSIEMGAREGQSQIAKSGNEWVGGKLKIEMHTPVQKDGKEQVPNEIDSTCTLYDVDDDF